MFRDGFDSEQPAAAGGGLQCLGELALPTERRR